jgi:LytS/YehU family sensor histidine kinase
MTRRTIWLCLAVFGWWTLNGLAVGAEWMTMRDAAGQAVTWRKAMPPSMAGAWGWVPLALGLFWLADRHPIERGRIGRALALHAVAVAAIVLVRAVYIHSLDPWLHWYATPPTFGAVLLQSVKNNLFQAWMVVGVAHAVVYAARARQREEQSTRLQAQLAEARLAALSSQLNPHFLFNALNSIAELVHRDANAADRMIVGLAALLRSSLDQARNQEVPLSEELRLLGHYLDIEKIRLGDRLRVDWAIAPGVDAALVPPLLLQPIVENAVRHGVSRRVTPGRIGVSARREAGRLVLEVTDDGGGLAPAGAASGRSTDAASGAPSGTAGLGLATTRGRLECLYGADAWLELAASPQGGMLARLSLPLREWEAAA